MKDTLSYGDCLRDFPVTKALMARFFGIMRFNYLLLTRNDYNIVTLF